MSNTKLKIKKKKARDKRVKEKVLKKRCAIRKQQKEEREYDRQERFNRDRIEPIVDPLHIIDRDIKIAEQDVKEAKSMNSSERVIQALENNLSILRNMREEYLEEEKSREKMSKELEEKGCKTIDDKVNYLKEQVKAEQLQIVSDKQLGAVGGSADVSWSSNTHKKKKPLHMRKETAVCEVIKAEDRKDLKK